MENKQEITYYGIILAITGIVLFSAKAVMVKLAYEYEINSTHLLLFRMVFCSPFYLGIALTKKPLKPAQIGPKEYLWLIFFGFVGYYLASLFDFIGLQYISAGLERIILFVYPTLVLLISKVFLKISISIRQIVAILITYFGVLITFWGDIHTGSEALYYGGGLIFLSALTYAMYLVGSGWLIPKFGVLCFTSYAMLVSTLCIVIQYLLLDNTSLWEYPWQIYVLALLMALFSTLIPSFLVSTAISKMGASNFSIFGSLGPISTILLAYVFLGERLTSWQLLGASIVLIGVFVVTQKKKQTITTSTKN